MLPAQYLIGVDSDGTAFDSMNLKHQQAFIPAALEMWPMPDQVARAFIKFEEDVNLHSSSRGINRFPGLLMTFELLRQAYPEEGSIPSMIDLKQYVNAERKHSISTLECWIKAHPSAELRKVLAWSVRADEMFEKACVGIQPILGVKETLADIANQAAVAVVSSAAKASLERDWKEGELMPYVDLLMSQEDGSKDEQLKKAISRCGTHVHAMMLGDTAGDEKAAQEANALFCPILPGKESKVWTLLRTVILPAFLAGKYNHLTQQMFVHELDLLYSQAL